MAAEQDGTVSVKFTDMAESSISPPALVMDERLSSSGTATPTGVQITACPTTNGSPYMGRRLIVFFNPAANATLASASSGLRIPVDVVNDKTMQLMYQRTINFGALTASVTNPVCVAGVDNRIGHYDAPVGTYLRLSAGAKAHVFLTT